MGSAEQEGRGLPVRSRIRDKRLNPVGEGGRAVSVVSGVVMAGIWGEGYEGNPEPAQIGEGEAGLSFRELQGQIQEWPDIAIARKGVSQSP